MKSGRAVWLKAGEKRSRGASNPHAGQGPKPSWPFGCKARQVRVTQHWRRESGGGNTDQPDADNIRVSAEKAEHEKLNDERGIKPLPVNRSRDGAESGNTCAGRIKGSFCILALEISVWWHTGNYGEAGASRIPEQVRTQTSYRRDCCSEESD